VQMAVVEQLVEQDGVARQVVGTPARGARQVGHALERVRVLLQQGEVGATPADGLEQLDAAGQRLVRVLGAGGDLDDARHQRVEPAADLARQLLVARAVVQFGEAVRDLLRIDVAEPGQHGVEGLLAAGGPDLVERILAVLLGRVAEHGLEVAADDAAVRVEPGEQVVAAGAVHGTRDQRQIVGRGGQVVGLGVVQELQAVLEPAQEDIGLGQFAYGLGRQDAALGQLCEHLQRRTDLQAAVTATANELEDLGDELDLADAAGADLDVVGAVAARDLAADLRVQVAHRVEGAVVEVLAEHEGAGDLLEFGVAL